MRVDIFSCIEEKAGRETAGYEGGTSSSFASIFVILVSELRLTDAWRCKIIARNEKEKEQ